MSAGHTGRRTVLKMLGAGLSTGATGCLSESPGQSNERVAPEETPKLQDLLRFLPTGARESTARAGGFSYTGIESILREQQHFGPHSASRLFGRSFGERGWIPPQTLTNQISWGGNMDWDGIGYAFRVPYTKSEIVDRYMNGVLRESPVDSYRGYEIFRRSTRFHAVTDGLVIRKPVKDLASVHSYLDDIEAEASLEIAPRLAEAFGTLDTEYFLSVRFGNSASADLERAPFDADVICRTVEPDFEQFGPKEKFAVLTENPRRVEEQAMEEGSISIANRYLREIDVQREGNLVIFVAT